MDYLWAFLIGGLFCAIGQVLMDFTKLTPARILVAYVTGGLTASAAGITAAMTFAFIFSLFFKSSAKE